MPSPFVLVLDNYHEVAQPSILHAVLTDAVAEVPPDSCIVVISRTESPPPMARLRANREMEIIGWNELRLTRAESDRIVEDWDAGIGEFAREQLYDERVHGNRGCVIHAM